MPVAIPIPLVGEWVPIANILITDTQTHTYITDPPSSAGTGIDIIKVGDILGSGNNTIKAWALWVFNNENQTVTVQPITNVIGDGSLPDILISGTSFSVNAGDTGMASFEFYKYPVEYVSVYLSFSTPPTAKSSTATNLPMGVYCVLYIYYG